MLKVIRISIRKYSLHCLIFALTKIGSIFDIMVLRHHLQIMFMGFEQYFPLNDILILSSLLLKLRPGPFNTYWDLMVF